MNLKITFMRHIFSLLTALLCALPLPMMADNYAGLWKQYEQAQQKDLPKTELQVLDNIISKATKERAYGHLVKAQMLRVSVQSTISPDSLAPDRARMEDIYGKTQDKALHAVYAVTIGRMYQVDSEDSESQQKAKQYFAAALADPDALAAKTDKSYEPVVEVGVDSKVFGHDLLHVIGFATNDMKTLHKYYEAHGNREAAFYTALRMVEDSPMDTGERMQKLDSLIGLYGDLQLSCEAAIDRDGCMRSVNNDDRKARYDYLTWAIGKWKGYQRVASLQNELSELTLPRFDVRLSDMTVSTHEAVVARINNACGISSVAVKVYRLREGVTAYGSINDSKTVADLKRGARLLADYGQTKSLGAHAQYEVFADSLTLRALPLGAYLLEFSCNDSSVRPAYGLLRVADLMAVWMQNPDRRVRIAVVDATSGMPVSDASVALSTKKNGPETILTTDASGEVMTSKQSFSYIRVLKGNDKYSPQRYFSSYFNYYKAKPNQLAIRLYTDRRIYRPAQTVHVALVAYNYLTPDELSAANGQTLELRLMDANGKEVKRQSVTTDDLGTASADFILPSGGLTGTFSIAANSQRVFFNVEEYKRPTFSVKINDYKEKYSDGDTITLTGKAQTYAGVPVQGGEVDYEISHQRPWWWGISGAYNDFFSSKEHGTATTDADGSFKIRVPLTLPKRHDNTPIYCNIKVEANVTDISGETRDAVMTIPLSSKATILRCNMPSRVLKDSLTDMRFTYLNNAGQPISGSVKYTIDGHQYTAKTNEKINIRSIVATLKSGSYSLEAVCGTDTVRQKFVIFTLKDKRAVVETHDWYYLSAAEFPSDGGPVYIQLGSSDELLHVMYSLISGNKVLESGAKELQGELLTQKFTYKEEYGDALLAVFAWVKDGKAYTHEATIKKPQPDRRLIMKWITFRDKLTPGQQEEWTLNITRPGGKVVKAQLMATLFDKSLDQIRPHNWFFDDGMAPFWINTAWYNNRYGSINLNASRQMKWLNVDGLNFSSLFDTSYNLYEVVKYTAPVIRNGVALMAAPMAKSDKQLASAGTNEEVRVRGITSKAFDSATAENVVEGVFPDEKSLGASKKTADSFDESQMRENLQETAFFYPNVITDANGNAKLKFTLPESVTTWRFLGLAHDREMNYGLIEAEAVAKKTVMVQPNVPRFLRVGDKAMITSRITNTSSEPVSGTATMTLIDAESGKTVYEQQAGYQIEAEGTTAVSFSYSPESADKILVCRITAAGSGYSDGEQHYLPILPDKELVTNTVAFTQIGKGTKKIDLSKLFAVDDAANSLTVEYTNNPAWLMVQALPYVGNVNEKNAVSLAAAYYANSLASNLLHQSPVIKRMLDSWAQETGQETTLMSALEKDQELKTLVLDETPWVTDAAKESDQKRQLLTFFDENTINNKLESTLGSLKQLQRADGSFSWWPGMDGSRYMTVTVVGMLTRLNAMTESQQQTSQMLFSAFSFLDKKIAEEVIELKKMERKGMKKVSPSEFAYNYLYSNALAERPTTADVNYLLSLIEKNPTRLTIYGKANCAVILALYGHNAKAREMLKSAMEYTVYNDEMGRYYDTPKAQYSWFDYRIPTQTAAIEALQRLQPTDSVTISDMQRWLLQSKRTQAWDTPINSVNAIYVFLNGQTDKLTPADDTPTSINVDGKPLSADVQSAAIGYVKGRYQGAGMRQFTAQKTTSGTSWGAVYAQFMQRSADVKGSSTGLKVTRELISDGKQLKVGDRVKVRITIVADRDYDFVQVIDRRAACMEPVGQISGYHWGYYCAPRDNTTSYYFDRMAKGKHVVETEYFIDREGDYSTGTCIAQCAYSPEFMGREAAMELEVSR